MCKRQSHWPVLTYHHPCFDFSKSVRENADDLINIHEPRSIRDQDEFVSSSGLEKCLSNGCSAVNGCRQNETLIKTSQHSSPSVNIRS